MEDELLKEIKKMNKLLVLVLVKGQDKIISILQLTAAGYTQSEIGDLLGIARKSVENAIYNYKIKQKKNGKTTAKK